MSKNKNNARCYECIHGKKMKNHWEKMEFQCLKRPLPKTDPSPITGEQFYIIDAKCQYPVHTTKQHYESCDKHNYKGQCALFEERHG